MHELHKILRERGGLLVVDETLTCLRTGKVWACDHISGFIPDMIVFGKSMQIAGLTRHESTFSSPVADVTIPANAATLLKANVVLTEVLKYLRDDVTPEKMREFVESKFDNVQGIGMIMAARAQKISRQTEYKNVREDKYSCTLLDDVYRFTFPLDVKHLRPKRKRR